MTIASAVGKFYGARDAASVWPMLCVHLNITLYTPTPVSTSSSLLLSSLELSDTQVYEP